MELIYDFAILEDIKGVSMIFTKCIYSPVESIDGLRISIMSRHTLDDGVTPDVDIINFDEHLPVLGPTPRLIGRYYRKEITWCEFKREFNVDLQLDVNMKYTLKRIIEISKRQNVTLMCKDISPIKCHRRLVARRIHSLDASVQVHIH